MLRCRVGVPSPVSVHSAACSIDAFLFLMFSRRCSLLGGWEALCSVLPGRCICSAFCRASLHFLCLQVPAFLPACRAFWAACLPALHSTCLRTISFTIPPFATSLDLHHLPPAPPTPVTALQLPPAVPVTCTTCLHYRYLPAVICTAPCRTCIDAFLHHFRILFLQVSCASACLFCSAFFWRCTLPFCSFRAGCSAVSVEAAFCFLFLGADSASCLGMPVSVHFVLRGGLGWVLPFLPSACWVLFWACVSAGAPGTWAGVGVQVPLPLPATCLLGAVQM